MRCSNEGCFCWTNDDGGSCSSDGCVCCTSLEAMFLSVFEQRCDIVRTVNVFVVQTNDDCVLLFKTLVVHVVMVVSAVQR